MPIVHKTGNGNQISIAIALFLSYCGYAFIYIFELCYKIKPIIPANSKPKSLSLANPEEILFNIKNEKTYATNINLRIWVIKGYHQNMFFYTIACLVALVSIQHPIIDVVVYIGAIQ